MASTIAGKRRLMWSDLVLPLVLVIVIERILFRPFDHGQ
jgi:hypothetical protein